MFATILPGIRELRVPLAAGFIWLAAISIATSWLLPAADTNIEFFRQIYQVTGLFNGAVLISVTTFVAYLLGIILAPFHLRNHFRKKNAQPVTDLSTTTKENLKARVLRDIVDAQRRDVNFKSLIEKFPKLEKAEADRYSDELREQLADEARSELSYQSSQSTYDFALAEQWEWLRGEAPAIADLVIDELSLAEISLQANSKEIYDRFDRDKAEGEFRSAVVIPLAALSLALVGRTFEFMGFISAVWLLILIACFYLNRSAQDRALNSKDAIVLAILAGTSDSPTLKLITDTQAPVKAAVPAS